MKKIGYAFAFASRFSTKFALVSFLYFVSRWNHLHRELANEEGLFIAPGKLLFAGKGFHHYIGESVLGINNINPFHKPPLTSFLLGLFSLLSPDPVTGGRVLPLLIGYLVCLLPLLLTGSMTVSFIILLSPFFYAAASHMQTDPTVGLLGYSLIIAFWHQLIWKEKKRSWLLFFGIAILWLGKIEIMAIASLASLIVLFFTERKLWLPVLKSVLLASFVGCLVFVLATYLLGKTAGFGFQDSVVGVFQTIITISGGLQKGVGRDPGLLMQFFGSYQGDLLLRLMAVSLSTCFVYLLWLEKPDWRWSFVKKALPFLVFFLVPWFVYTSGGYPGDGFPRYLLIVFPSLFVLLAQFLTMLPQRSQWSISIVLVLIGCNLFFARFAQFWRQDGIVTVPFGEAGCRDATQFALNVATGEELILAPERDILLDLNRKWITPDGFEPYPDAHAAALLAIEKIRVFVLHKNYFLGMMPNSFREEFFADAKIAEKKAFHFGDYIVYVAPELIRNGSGTP